MNRQEKDLLILFVMALVLNVIVAALNNLPGYVDAAYYFNGGLAIVEGRGLVENYFWNWVNPPASLPTSAFAYWQPLASFLSAGGIWLFGKATAYRSAQAVFVFFASFLPVLTYMIARQFAERRHALLAGLLMVFSGYFVLVWSTPETFTPYALLGAGAFVLASYGRTYPRWWVWLLAGGFAGLAHLTRADGILLVMVVLLVSLLPARVFVAGEGGHVGALSSARLAYTLAAVAGYLLVMLPWFLRNYEAFGAVQAPGGLSTIWMTDYNDLFSYPSDLTAGSFFARPFGEIFRSRWSAFMTNLANLIGVNHLVYLLPLSVVGLWRRTRNTWLLPPLIYGALLFIVMTLVFALPGKNGGWWHSSSALMPFIMIAAALGLEDILRWVSLKRSVWQFKTAWPFFSVSSVILAALITIGLVAGSRAGLRGSNTISSDSMAVYADVANYLDDIAVPRGVLVMSNNPPGFYLQSGFGGIPLVNGDEEAHLRAADDYHASYLVIDQNVAPAMYDFYILAESSGRLRLIREFGPVDSPTYLYAIAPPQ